MTTVEEIEDAVASLAPDKLAKFRTWFEAFEATAPGTYSADAAELHGIDRGLDDATQGRFVSEAAVENVFAKYRKV